MSKQLAALVLTIFFALIYLGLVLLGGDDSDVDTAARAFSSLTALGAGFFFGGSD